MAAHTKIIDFFGLPACGKTTLVRCFCEKYGKERKIVTIKQLVKEAKRDGRNLCNSFSLRYYLEGIRLRMLAPFNQKRRDIPLLNWPSHARYYCYAKKYSDYDIVLVDHGDIQDFVSLERGDDLHNNKRFSNACSRYLEQSLADVYVYCMINPELALDRMEGRGRNTGRIDVMGDREEQLSALESEKSRFDYYADVLRKKNKCIIEIDMNKSIDEIVLLLFDRIIKL